MLEHSKNRTVAEFFAGIGLVRAGLEKAGWTITFANDIDLKKRSLYLNHYVGSNHFVLDDIHNLKPKQIPTVDLATASFPCTDLSLAGRMTGLGGKHSSAFWGFVDILEGMGKRKPPLILLENVPGFLTSNEGKDLHNALIALNEIGYAVDIFIIDAVRFVPQSRARLFIVGKFKREPQIMIKHYLPKTELRPERLTKFIYQHPNIYWDINTHLPQLPPIQNRLSTIIDNIPKTSPLWFSKDRVKFLINQTSGRHSSKINELKESKTYNYLTAFRRVRNGKSMAEIRWDGIAGCLRTPKGGSAKQIVLEVGKGEVNVRLLTPRECAKLMGADDFKLSGTVNDALFGFGDAVCVHVVTWIAENYLNPELLNWIEQKQKISKYATA